MAILSGLPGEYRDARLDGGTATWLWRTLRSVEAAGLNASQVARDAIRSASFVMEPGPATGSLSLVEVDHERSV